MAREKRIESFRALVALWREDRQVNGGLFWPGFQALAVYRLGVWKEGIGARPLRLPVTLVHRLLAGFVRNFYGIELPETARIGRRLIVAHQHGIILHGNAQIGDDCLIRQGVSLGQNAPTPGVWVGDVPAPRLGNRVEVGAGAVLMGGITIGDGVRIGPNAVVMTNVPAGAIVTAPMSRIMVPPKRRPAPPPEVAAPEAAVPDAAVPSPGAAAPVAAPAPDTGSLEEAGKAGA